MVSVDFVRQLYRNQFSYADRMTPEELERIHCPYPDLEGTVLEYVSGGKIVFLTGNPGDGKTHLIHRLQQQLSVQRALILQDFNVLDDDERASFCQTLRSKIEAGAAAVIAANEYPLLQLVADYSHVVPELQAVEEQMRNSLVYGPQERTAQGQVVVLDLNLRQTLGAEVVGSMLDKLSALEPCPVCGSGCPVHRNAAALAGPARETLLALLQLVAFRRAHVTMRDMVGYLAYVLTGGMRCSEAPANARDYADLVFTARDGLGQDVARMDPCRLPDPREDDALWRHAEQSLHAGGLESDTAEILPQFRREKRRRFLAEGSGQDLFRRLDPYADQFAALLRTVELGDVEGGRADAIAAINRFFDPSSVGGEHLRVWTTLRYDPRHEETTISNATLAAERVDLATPRPASHMRCIPYTPDHLILRATLGDGQTAVLRIDLALYHVLRKVGQGLPPTLVPERYAYTLYQFMNRLARVSRQGNRFLVRPPDAEATFAITMTHSGQYVD